MTAEDVIKECVKRLANLCEENEDVSDNAWVMKVTCAIENLEVSLRELENINED